MMMIKMDYVGVNFQVEIIECRHSLVKSCSCSSEGGCLLTHWKIRRMAEVYYSSEEVAVVRWSRNGIHFVHGVEILAKL